MRRLASLLFASLGLAAMHPALAADLSARAPVYKAPATLVASWTGFYVGGNVGYGWGDGSIGLAPHNPVFSAGVIDFALANGVLPQSAATNPRGVLGGLQAGYNWQSGAAVWGIETDISSAAMKASSSTTTTIFLFPTVATTQEQKVDWIGTVRGRIGATVTPDWLLYVTGGLAYGHAKATTTISDPTGGSGTPCQNMLCGTGSVNGWRVGWTVGGGGEYRFAANWSIKAEYLYYDLGSARYTFFNPNFPVTPGPDRGFDASTSFRGQIARIGINYQFSPGPVVARY